MNNKYDEDSYEWDNTRDSADDENSRSAFYQPRQYDDLVESADYTDVAEEYVSKSRKKFILTLLFSIIAIAGIAFGAYSILKNPETTQDDPSRNTVSQSDGGTTAQPIDKPTPNYKEPSNPATKLLENAPKAKASETKVFTDDKTVQTSDGSILNFKGSKVKGTVNECVVQSANDFCNAATVTDDNDKEYYVYYLKDAAHSRFFENPIDFTKVDQPSSASAIATISTLDGKETPVLLTVNKNSSGFMIISENNSKEDLKTLAENMETL